MVREVLKFDSIKKRILVILAIFLVGFLGLYAYFLNQSIQNIVIKKERDKEIAYLNASLGTLELEYVKARNGVKEDVAKNLGFRETDAVYFVERSLEDTRLSLGNEI